MKPPSLKRELLKQLIPVAVFATVVACALTAPAVAAKGGKGPNATTTTLALASERVYWPDTWEPNCLTEDDIDQRNFAGSLYGSHSTSFQLCDLSTDGWTSGGEGLQSKVAVSGTISDLTITAPDGSVAHAIFTGQSRGLSFYEVCVVPPYYASTDTGTSPLAGGAWTVTLSGSISSASWTTQATMTDTIFQQQSCPVSQQRIIS
jgi:hypothetical protein